MDKRMKDQAWMKRLIAIFLIIALAATGFWWHAHKQREDKPEDIIRQIGTHIILPSDEQPALITVVDKNKIHNIPFLERSAQNGDKLLVYSKSKRAILYRPAQGKIVDVGPVSVAAPAKGQ